MQGGVSLGRLDLGLEDRFQRLRSELGVEAFGLNLMHLAPGQRGRIHAHERQEEVFVVLHGTLTLELGEDERHELARGALARVAPDVRRRLATRGEGPVRFLAIGGAGDHEGRDGIAFEDWTAPEGRPPAEVPLPDDLPAGG